MAPGNPQLQQQTRYDGDTTQILRRSAWTTTIGNAVQYKYYMDGDMGGNNPSGNPQNLKAEIFLDGLGNEVLCIYYKYDDTDRIIYEFSAPNYDPNYS